MSLKTQFIFLIMLIFISVTAYSEQNTTVIIQSEQNFQSLAVHQEQIKLLSQINEAMTITNTNGIDTTLYEQWFKTHIEKELTLRELSIYLIPLIVFFLAMSSYFYYRLQVERKQAEKKIIESESFAKATIDASSSDICVLDNEGKILSVNQAWRNFYDDNSSNSNAQDYFVGTNYYQICRIAMGNDSEECSPLINGALQVARHERDFFSIEYPCHSPTEQRWFNALVTRFNDCSGNIVITHENITARKQTELREKSRSRLLELIMSDETLPVILQAIVRDVEQESSAMLCSILLLDETGKHLLNSASLRLPAFYNEAIHGMEIGMAFDPCSTAAFTGERVIVDDIQNHSYSTSYKELADKAGLRACWSEPIRSTQGEVLGIFAIYHDKINQPTQVNVTLIEQAANLASIAIEKIQIKLALQTSEERWQFALEGSGDGVWDWDVPTSKVWFSKRFKNMLGYAEEEIGTALVEWSSRIHPEDKACVMADLQRHLDGHSATYVNEQRVRCKDGSYKWILDRGLVITRDDAGKPLRVVGTHSDISERKQSEEKLKLAASVFSNAREGIMITDASGTIIEVNKTFSLISGYSREEVIGQNPRILQSGRQTPYFYAQMWKSLLEKDHWYGEMWNRHKSGELYAELLKISTVQNTAGQVQNYVALFSDITLMKNHQGQLEHIVHYDVLTNLPNRVLLADRLNQAIVQSQRYHNSLAVVFLDLDKFKAVNDTHGHDVGDELLIRVSQLMKDALRELDTLARIGGDEFVAVLPDLDKVEDCQHVLERLLLAASEPITIGDIVLHVSASIGVSVYPQDGTDADILMRHADQAMYQAKQSGKNCYHLFDSAQDDAINIRRENLDNISAAVDRREFVLHYQPKVNMTTGKVVGVEALIRWQHPERGLVLPLNFLPIIEDHPISLDIGEWVIDSALSQISQWQKMGIKLPISINISAYQLQQVNFATRLITLLAAYTNVSPNDLELEVLETSALVDVIQITATMHACRAIGVKFALDDFGTGYSSLTYLRRLPVSVIKIDQSFVRGMLHDADDLAIVKGVISLANAFQCEVIAEGVETIQHGRALLQLGCELAQGYGIARPMPADEVTVWVKGWQPYDAWRTFIHAPLEDARFCNRQSDIRNETML
jgi:diguanylate cyclase (GGDEF)-like protein/PAS domain S-box-containing protein